MDELPQKAPKPDDVIELLERLLPGDQRVTFQDVNGKEWSSPLAISIRKQRTLMAMIRKVAEEVVTNGQLNISKISSHFMTDEGLDDLVSVFETVHESALRDMRAHTDDPNSDAEDLVSFEEMVAAVLPFCVKPLASIVRKVAPLMDQQQ